MKAVFFGGGGFRTLALARSMMAVVPEMKGGEIYLYDLNADRIEAMGKMIQKSPELAEADCTVEWGTDLDEALPGADLVSFSLMAGSRLAFNRSQSACGCRGFLGSDQISPSGAFLALKGGPIVLECAQAMEKHCPDAWLLIRANPVPVLSAAVNNHTRIRALGICDGFNNHMWDLSRLMGRDEMDTGYDVDVAGINHGSLILRGTYQGEDLFEVLERYIGPDWQPPRCAGFEGSKADWLEFALCKMIELYEKFGVTIFSNEGDGTGHLYYEEAVERQAAAFASGTQAEQETRAPRLEQERLQADREFQEQARGEVPEDYWAKQERPDETITVRIAQALGGGGKQKIVSSHPNRGGVEGFKDRTVLEYSQYLSPEGLEPVENLYVPDAFHGLITSLATHQTLLGDAIATQDPRLLYEALYAYPMKQNSRASRELYRKLLEINQDEIPPVFQMTKEYL